MQIATMSIVNPSSTIPALEQSIPKHSTTPVPNPGLASMEWLQASHLPPSPLDPTNTNSASHPPIRADETTLSSPPPFDATSNKPDSLPTQDDADSLSPPPPQDPATHKPAHGSDESSRYSQLRINNLISRPTVWKLDNEFVVFSLKSQNTTDAVLGSHRPNVESQVVHRTYTDPPKASLIPPRVFTPQEIDKLQLRFRRNRSRPKHREMRYAGIRDMELYDRPFWEEQWWEGLATNYYGVDRESKCFGCVALGDESSLQGCRVIRGEGRTSCGNCQFEGTNCEDWE